MQLTVLYFIWFRISNIMIKSKRRQWYSVFVSIQPPEDLSIMAAVSNFSFSFGEMN